MLVSITFVATAWDFIIYSVRSLFLPRGVVEKYEIEEVLAIRELRISNFSNTIVNLTCWKFNADWIFMPFKEPMIIVKEGARREHAPRDGLLLTQSRRQAERGANQAAARARLRGRRFND